MNVCGRSLGHAVRAVTHHIKRIPTAVPTGLRNSELIEIPPSYRDSSSCTISSITNRFDIAPTAMQLQYLTSNEEAVAAGALAAKAMRSTESYLEIYRGEVTWRELQLAHLFQGFIKLKRMSGESNARIAKDLSGAIVCSFLFAKSTDQKASFWSKVQCGILEIPFRSNFASFARLIKADEWHSEQMAGILGDRPHYVLNMMVVSPSEQGRGVGSACLSQALAEADAIQYPVVLSTHLEINVRFYSKL